LLDRTRVSTNGVDALDPVGGVHTIEIVDGGDPRFKLEIGRDPDEIENHDPIESDPDCTTLSDPDPLFEIEIVLVDVDDTDPNEIVDDDDGVDVIDGAAVQLNVNLTLG